MRACSGGRVEQMKDLFVMAGVVRRIDKYRTRQVGDIIRRTRNETFGVCAHPPDMAQMGLAASGGTDQNQRRARPIWPLVDPGNGVGI